MDKLASCYHGYQAVVCIPEVEYSLDFDLITKVITPFDPLILLSRCNAASDANNYCVHGLLGKLASLYHGYQAVVCIPEVEYSMDLDLITAALRS